MKKNEACAALVHIKDIEPETDIWRGGVMDYNSEKEFKDIEDTLTFLAGEWKRKNPNNWGEKPYFIPKTLTTSQKSQVERLKERAEEILRTAAVRTST